MIKNPFLTYGYNGPDFFCDRVEETKRLTSLLVNGTAVATTIILPVMASFIRAALKRWLALMPGITTPILSVGHRELEGVHKDCPSFNCQEYRDYFESNA